MSLIVTGTGTDVGKTLTCAVLAARYGQARPLIYWKPIATGVPTTSTGDALCTPDAAALAAASDSAVVQRLAGGACVEVLAERYRFSAPQSPHWAAHLAGEAIVPAELMRCWQLLNAQLAATQQHIDVVEGAGGLLVPLTDTGFMMLDLFALLRLPCLVVAHSGVGTINHTLLTLQALRQRGITPAGVVLNGPAHPENRRAIATFGAVPVVGEIPPLSAVTPASVAQVARHFDPDGVLDPLLLHEPSGATGSAAAHKSLSHGNTPATAASSAS